MYWYFLHGCGCNPFSWDPKLFITHVSTVHGIFLVFANTKCTVCTDVGNMEQKYGARILKYLVEAEKLTFRGELSFQRSAGLTVATIFCVNVTTI